jgi:hypothetical protein
LEQPIKFEFIINIKGGQTDRSYDSADSAGTGGSGDEVKMQKCKLKVKNSRRNS